VAPWRLERLLEQFEQLCSGCGWRSKSPDLLGIPIPAVADADQLLHPSATVWSPKSLARRRIARINRAGSGRVAMSVTKARSILSVSTGISLSS